MTVRKSGVRWAFGLAVLLLTSVAAHAVTVISGPTLTMNPNNRTPLAGVVELETDVAVQVELTIANGGDIRTVTFPAATVHYLPVLGLKPDRTYAVDIELIPGGPIGTLFATTDPLPAEFPTLVTTVSEPEQMEPGYTFINCLVRAQGDLRPQYSVIVDNAGEVVWYATQCLGPMKLLPNGKIQSLMGAQETVRESDMLENHTELVFDNPDARLHHDFHRTPHGTYLSLSFRTAEIPDFPTSDTDPAAPTAPATVRDDVVVEFLPDGTLRREWALVDMLDTSRIAYSSLATVQGEFDWTHSNAVYYNLADDSIIVSVRHQDAVIKFSRETGNLQWILGPHDNWSPEFQQFLLGPVGGEFRWQFHQHAPMWTGDGTIVLFDNGNFRASPFDGTTPMPDNESFSRGVEFGIDEATMTVQQVWEYGEFIAEPIYSSFISDADWQPITGNVLTTFGGTSYVGGVSSADLGLGLMHARIVETTDDDVPIEVFNLMIYDPTGGRISSYRSEKIPDLYPQQYVKTPNGVGDSLGGTKVAGQPRLLWSVPPVDATHDAADHYRIYNSNSAAGAFSMLDSTAFTEIDAGGAGTLVFYKLVAANIAGTSGDEPAP
ncbi:MAG: aryl-sulfate sulfotransferase [bacterium]|nr:aryl-sulfate sulfotransferase [bacterium]